jgi:hypothetical protein
MGDMGLNAGAASNSHQNPGPAQPAAIGSGVRTSFEIRISELGLVSVPSTLALRSFSPLPPHQARCKHAASTLQARS